MFFEQENGPQDPVMADCQFCYGLILVKLGELNEALNSLSIAKQVFSNTISAFDQKTKDVEELINSLQMLMQGHE